MDIGDAISKGEGSVIRRRDQLDRLTPIEVNARRLQVDVEALGAHPALTDVSIGVGLIRGKLADWVDSGRPGAA